MKPRRIRLFIKPGCGWCREARDWLDERQVPHELLDVTRDARARAEMLELSGQSLTPTLDVDGEILADFGVEELEPFLKPFGY